MTEYSIWMEIEKHTVNDETGDESWEEVGDTMKLGTFETLKEAHEAMSALEFSQC